MTRTGKIARLPRALREQLNRRLRNGEQGKRLVKWLNGLSEVRHVVAEDFGGRVVSEQNLSEWKAGGYREWQAHQQALERAGDLASSATELTESAGAMADHLAIILTARYVAALAEWDGDPEAVARRKLRVLRALCQDVVELRRGDHSAARLKIEQARLDSEREETEEEVVEHFRRWAQNPKVREAICGKCLSPEEREQRLRHIFGLNASETAHQPEAGADGEASAVSKPGSNPIRLDQSP